MLSCSLLFSYRQPCLLKLWIHSHKYTTRSRIVYYFQLQHTKDYRLCTGSNRWQSNTISVKSWCTPYGFLCVCVDLRASCCVLSTHCIFGLAYCFISCLDHSILRNSWLEAKKLSGRRNLFWHIHLIPSDIPCSLSKRVTPRWYWHTPFRSQ